MELMHGERSAEDVATGSSVPPLKLPEHGDSDSDSGNGALLASVRSLTETLGVSIPESMRKLLEELERVSEIEEREFPDPETHGFKIADLGKPPDPLPPIEESFRQYIKIPENAYYFTHLGLARISVDQCTILDLSNNGLDHIPEKISTLKNLRKLILWGNQIKEIPDWLGLMSTLEELNLHSNCIEFIPKSLGQLKYLEALDVRNNNIREVPLWLWEDLWRLEWFDIQDNPVSKKNNGEVENIAEHDKKKTGDNDRNVDMPSLAAPKEQEGNAAMYADVIKKAYRIKDEDVGYEHWKLFSDKSRLDVTDAEDVANMVSRKEHRDAQGEYAQHETYEHAYTQGGGDQYEYAQAEGDQYDYAQEEGDQYDYAQIEGDQYDYAQEEGDQHQYAQHEGDQYDYAQEEGGQHQYAQHEGDQYDYAQEEGGQHQYAQHEGDQYDYAQEKGAGTLENDDGAVS